MLIFFKVLHKHVAWRFLLQLDRIVIFDILQEKVRTKIFEEKSSIFETFNGYTCTLNKRINENLSKIIDP